MHLGSLSYTNPFPSTADPPSVIRCSPSKVFTPPPAGQLSAGIMYITNHVPEGKSSYFSPYLILYPEVAVWYRRSMVKANGEIIAGGGDGEEKNGFRVSTSYGSKAGTFKSIW